MKISNRAHVSLKLLVLFLSRL